MGFSYQEEKQKSKEKIKKCKVEDIWQILGKRWALSTLKNLSTHKSMRFSEIKKQQPGLSSTVLSSRLFELEKEGLIQKKIYPEIPPKVEYKLTKRAKELESILEDLGKWADRWNQ
ncbi:winged helix-turn-helix transcriptional regulator [Nitrosopumilus sp.]|uniref:winged helix-turn-helix transcriptional regulator n=1 Tax=Nitrosopumilus sp. TaxID=2024843 RepID=UPI0034A00DC8